MILLISIPVIIGLVALGFIGSATYAQSGGQYLFPHNMQGILFLMVGVVLGLGGLRVLAALLYRDDDDLGPITKMPAKAEVIPVYEYQDVLYEAPMTTVENFRASLVHNHRAKPLEGMPSSVPLHQARPLHPSLPETPVNTYGQPEYMVDGTLIGYRYFDRDVEGNLLSVGAGGVFGGDWGQGSNTAHDLPTQHNKAGLWAAYTPDSPLLDPYKHHDVKAAVGFKGQVAFGDHGFRAEHGEVVQILEEKPLEPGEKPLKFHEGRTEGRF